MNRFLVQVYHAFLNGLQVGRYAQARTNGVEPVGCQLEKRGRRNGMKAESARK